MSAIYCGRKWGLGPAGELKEKGLAQAAAEGMGRNKGADVDVKKKVNGVWVGGFVSVKYIVPLEASFFIRSFHIAHRVFSTK